MTRAPRWPAWTLAAVLGGLLVAGLVTAVAVALLAAAFGADDVTPALTLLNVVAALALALLVIRAVARRAGVELSPDALGLRPPTPRMTLVMIGFGALVAGAAGAVLTLVAGVSLPLPDELDGDDGGLFGDAAQPAIVLDAGTAASVLARAVLGAIAIEVIARGFFLPALIAYAGRPVAIGVVALLWALAVEPAPLMLATIALSFALCVMYLQSGSILPGIAVNAGAQGYVMGRSFDWSAAESLGLALAAAALAYALALGLMRSWDRAHRRG